MSIETLKVDSILHITLNRPDAHNALDAKMISELSQVFSTIKNDFTISAVLMKGNGPSFCAGGDLNWMRQSMSFTKAQNIKDTQKLSEMYETIFQCAVPVVGIVHGNVMGGGVGLAAVCDIVAAEADTKFCLSEVRLGLVPSIISPYVLRKMHESDARPLMLTAEVFMAPRALTSGLVHFAGTLDSCEKFADEKLKMISKNGPEATRLTKNLIQKVKGSSWKSARQFTVRTIAERRASEEGQEGMKAFFEKRKPLWPRRKL